MQVISCDMDISVALIDMPTDKPKILITMDADLLRRINNFRFANHIETKSDAIRRLLDEALKKYEDKKK